MIRDFTALRLLFGQLLAEVQRIKSEGDYEAARQLIETYGVKVDPELHAEILERYERLGVAPYAGSSIRNMLRWKRTERLLM